PRRAGLSPRTPARPRADKARRPPLPRGPVRRLQTHPRSSFGDDGTVIVPEVHIAHVADAHARFFDAIQGLGDADVRRPSLLPGWSGGHVLTHLARNPASHARRTDAVAG